MTSKKLGLLAAVIAAALMWAIPSASSGKALDLQRAADELRQVTNGLGSAVDESLAKTDAALRKTAAEARLALEKAKRERQKAAARATAADPPTQPPLHGSDPHGQGGVAIVDTNPSAERPLGAKPDGSDSGEDAIVGRARGEKVGAAYHGHITILALLGRELAGVDSVPGETKNGPLQGIQTTVLDPLCTGLADQVCLSVLTANSTTTATSSTNDFAIARASVLGLGVGAAESKGVITEDANCQAAGGSASTADVRSPGGGAVAQAARSSSASTSCRGQAPTVTNTSQVIGLGGLQVPLPAAGCADGTPDTVSGIPAVLPIICNADDIAGAAAVREALDVYVLTVGNMSVAKETTAASESFSVAPPAPPAETSKPQCSDGVDNDGDNKVDAADPGCHSDGDATNAASYNPNDNDETDRKKPTGGSGDPSAPQCSDKKDNDGDGRTDSKDPGCHSDGNPNNPSSFDPDDDDESDDGGDGGDGGGGGAPTGGEPTDDSTLPFTGSDLVGLTLAGLLLLAGGMLLRRREDTSTAL